MILHICFCLWMHSCLRKPVLFCLRHVTAEFIEASLKLHQHLLWRRCTQVRWFLGVLSSDSIILPTFAYKNFELQLFADLESVTLVPHVDWSGDTKVK